MRIGINQYPHHACLAIVAMSDTIPPLAITGDVLEYALIHLSPYRDNLGNRGSFSGFLAAILAVMPLTTFWAAPIVPWAS